VLLCIDHLPHHGVRSPDGSTAERREALWPQPFLGHASATWSDAAGAPRWKGCLMRAIAEWRLAIEIVCAAPAPGSEELRSVGSLTDALAASAAMGRTQRLASCGVGPKLANSNQVVYYGLGMAGVVGLALMASDSVKLWRIRGAVLGQCVTSSWPEYMPGALPPPPREQWEPYLVARAKTIKAPILWIANDADERAPLAEALEIFEHLPSTSKILQILPGGRGAMRVDEMRAQFSWVLQKAMYRD